PRRSGRTSKLWTEPLFLPKASLATTMRMGNEPSRARVRCLPRGSVALEPISLESLSSYRNTPVAGCLKVPREHSSTTAPSAAIAERVPGRLLGFAPNLPKASVRLRFIAAQTSSGIGKASYFDGHPEARARIILKALHARCALSVRKANGWRARASETTSIAWAGSHL